MDNETLKHIGNFIASSGICILIYIRCRKYRKSYEDAQATVIKNLEEAAEQVKAHREELERENPEINFISLKEMEAHLRLSAEKVEKK